MKLHFFGHKSETEQSTTEVSQNQNQNKTKKAIGGVLLASGLVAGTIAGANALAPEAEKTSVTPNEQAPVTPPEQIVIPGTTLEAKPVPEATPTPAAPTPSEAYQQPTEEKTEPSEPIDLGNDVAVQSDEPDGTNTDGFPQPEMPVDLGNDAVEQYPDQPVEPQPTDVPEQPVQ